MKKSETRAYGSMRLTDLQRVLWSPTILRSAMDSQRICSLAALSHSRFKAIFYSGRTDVSFAMSEWLLDDACIDDRTEPRSVGDS